MVKVLRPAGKFSRCVDAAIAGIAVVETEADDFEDFALWGDHFAPPPPRHAEAARWMLKSHLQQRSRRVELEILQHQAERESRVETMRMYDEAIADATSRRRAAP